MIYALFNPKSSTIFYLTVKNVVCCMDGGLLLLLLFWVDDKKVNVMLKNK